LIPVELILLGLSPFFLLCVFVEFKKARQFYNVKDSVNNALLALLHQGSDALVLLLLMPLFLWLNQFSLFNIELTALSLFAGFILQDFLYYWFHRASHNIHWFWLAHVVHHSSTKMNFTTAFRQSILYPHVALLGANDFNWVHAKLSFCHCSYKFGLSVFCSHANNWTSRLG